LGTFHPFGKKVDIPRKIKGLGRTGKGSERLPEGGYIGSHSGYWNPRWGETVGLARRGVGKKNEMMHHSLSLSGKLKWGEKT